MTGSVGGGELEVSWAAGAGYKCEKQVVQRREPGSRTWTRTDLSASATTWTDSSVVSGQKYIYRIKAEMANRRGKIESNSASATVP